jgi:choline dehydrogenase-like flavoprotein
VTVFDFIVIGSGATGSMAAQTLIEGGARVLMLDGGLHDDTCAARIPPGKTFTQIRRSDPEQYRYFLGDDFAAAAYREIGAGAQLTPPRRFVVERATELLVSRSQSFVPLESLARGGLASAWGLLCGVYSSPELARASLPVGAMRDAYQAVADRIGICGAADDDARPYTYADLQRIQPPLPLDPTAAWIEARYRRRRRDLRACGFHLGRPALALLTQATGDRRATALRDMDFYDDAERAAWRPQLALEQLQRSPNFAYAGALLAIRFQEGDDRVEVVARGIEDGVERRFACKRLVLCCGTLGSARVVLRSLSGDDVRLPLLCNAYTYVPCVVPARAGKPVPERNNSLVQLVAFHDRDGRHENVAVVTLFTYRSLMLFRLLRATPLGVRDARILLRWLLPGLVIAGIDHPQSHSSGKRLRLEPCSSSPTGDALGIIYSLTDDERRAYDARERTLIRMLRELGVWALKRIRPPLGSSIHYGGTLPFCERETPFTLATDGRLHGTRSVYVADGSGFTFLPAKGLTLSLMANAHRTAAGLVRNT